MGPVRELRVVVTAENYEEALRFYRDALGLPVVESWENEGGSGAILDAAERLEAAGAERVGGPVVTPWQHRNVRLRAPDGMQLTLFTVLD